MVSGKEQELRTTEIMEFLVSHLKRELTRKEAYLVKWIAVYEDTNYDQVLSFFEGFDKNV